MSRPLSIVHKRRFRLACALFLVLWSCEARAQDTTEVTLKGAFLFNFARFTEWPVDALPPLAQVSACVIGDRAVGDAFARAVKGRQLDGRSILVTVLEANVPLPTCHLLYVSGVPRARMVEIVNGLRDTPVLTVSDYEGFAKFGGMVQVLVEAGKMKFRINTSSAKRARLQLSSRLLALAELVQEEATRRDSAGPSSARSSAQATPSGEQP
jgi:hypothetical protein